MLFILTLIPWWLWERNVRRQLLEHVDRGGRSRALAAARGGLRDARRLLPPDDGLGEAGSPKKDGEML